jgi:hypothetical protein
VTSTRASPRASSSPCASGRVCTYADTAAQPWSASSLLRLPPRLPVPASLAPPPPHGCHRSSGCGNMPRVADFHCLPRRNLLWVCSSVLPQSAARPSLTRRCYCQAPAPPRLGMRRKESCQACVGQAAIRGRDAEQTSGKPGPTAHPALHGEQIHALEAAARHRQFAPTRPAAGWTGRGASPTTDTVKQRRAQNVEEIVWLQQEQ